MPKESLLLKINVISTCQNRFARTSIFTVEAYAQQTPSLNAKSPRKPKTLPPKTPPKSPPPKNVRRQIRLPFRRHPSNRSHQTRRCNKAHVSTRLLTISDPQAKLVACSHFQVPGGDELLCGNAATVSYRHCFRFDDFHAFRLLPLRLDHRRLR